MNSGFCGLLIKHPQIWDCGLKYLAGSFYFTAIQLGKYEMGGASQYRLLKAGSLTMALAILFGAFGAHAIRNLLSAEMFAIYHTGNLYHLLHSLAILILGAVPANLLSDNRRTQIAYLMLGSLLIFSGSLYLLAVTGERWLGAITPLGGVGLILSWLILALSFKFSDV